MGQATHQHATPNARGFSSGPRALQAQVCKVGGIGICLMLVHAHNVLAA